LHIICFLQAGMTDTSAVTILLTPRFESAPRTNPQVKAKNFGACSRYCLPADSWVSRRNLLSCST